MTQHELDSLKIENLEFQVQLYKNHVHYCDSVVEDSFQRNMEVIDTCKNAVHKTYCGWIASSMVLIIIIVLLMKENKFLRKRHERY